MKKMLCCAGLLCVATATPCFAASPWDGTWKLNEAKSHMTGDIFKLTALPTGGFHLWADNGSFQYDYMCDGKDYPTYGHWTGTCKKVDDQHYEMAGKLDGKPVWQGTSVISDGGKFMTNIATEHRSDGTASTMTNTYERIGTGTGRAGTWKNVKSSETMPDVIRVSVNGDVLRSETPATRSVTTAKLDGSAARVEGPDSDADFVLKMKAEGTSKIRISSTYKGKPISEGFETISADGKTMTQVTWTPGKEADKQTYVYEKQ